MQRRDFLKTSSAAALLAMASRRARAAEKRAHGQLHLGLAGVGCGNGSLPLIDWYPCRDVGNTRLTLLDGSVLTARAIWDTVARAGGGEHAAGEKVEDPEKKQPIRLH